MEQFEEVIEVERPDASDDKQAAREIQRQLSVWLLMYPDSIESLIDGCPSAPAKAARALARGEAESSRQPQPSLADLERLVTTTREAGMRVDLAIEGEPYELPAALELSAFRIVQEGLTNALKHAGNAQTKVTLRYGERNLEVEVTDDGAGSTDGPGTRRGLAGIGERVAVFGGRFEAGPRPGGGWTVRAALPLTR